MDNEDEFLTRLSDHAAGAALLGASLRWGIEGILDNKEDLPDIAIRLQEMLEETLTLIEGRRRLLRRTLTGS